MSWRDKVKGARLPEAEVRLVMNGALAAEHERLTEELDKPSSSLAGKSEKRARKAELEKAMLDSVMVAGLRALPRPAWQALTDQHPPRMNDGVMDPVDRINGGLNWSTFPEAAVRATIATLDGEDPAFTDADWREFADALTQGQFDHLMGVTVGLNKGEVDLPFSSPGSERTTTSEPG